MKKIAYFLLMILLAELWISPYRIARADNVPVPSLTVQSISAGTYHMLALMSDNTVMSWGSNAGGQLGVGTTVNRQYASAVKDGSNQVLSDVAAVSAGSQHSLALKLDGTVYSWGYNGSKQLGRTVSGNGTVAVKITGFNNKRIIQISAGDSHSLALDEDGQVWAWGLNIYGQIGNGNTTTAATPVLVKASASLNLDHIQYVSAGQFHSLAITDTGQVLAWGMNTNGQLGDKTQTSRSYPVSVLTSSGSLSGVKLISAYGYNSFALKIDGTLWTWGDNSKGQLGTGNYQLTTRAQPVIGEDGLPFGDVKQIAAGYLHTAAVKNDGTLWTWGSNQNATTAPAQYNLGRNWDEATVPVPGQVVASEDGTPVTGVVSTAVGNTTTSIIRSDGSVWSVGGNLNSVLGGNRTETTSIKKLAQISFSTLAKTTWASSSARTAAAGETVQVSLQLADSAGTALNIGTDQVKMTADRGLVEAPTYVGLGKFTASFSSEQVGKSDITATVNGLEVPTKLSVQVGSGAPDASTSTLLAAPSSVTANGTNSATLTLELKDAFGNNMTSSVPNVSLSATKGTLGTVTELAYGKYQAQLTSTEAGTSTVSVQINQTAFNKTAVVNFLSGVPDANASSLLAAPSSVTANGTNSTTLTLELKDAFGNAMTSSVPNVSLSATKGTLGTVTELAYGKYQAQLTSTEAGTSTVSVQINQTAFNKTAVVNFQSGAPDANASSLLAAPSSVTANGTSSATLTLELKDAYGNAMTSSVPNVSLSATKGTLGTVTELAYGKYQAQLTSTEAGSSTVSVWINQAPFDKTTVVSFLSGAPDASTSSLLAAPSSVTANGTNSATLTLELKDAFGNNMTSSLPNVSLSATRGTLGTVTELAYGKYQAQLTSTEAGTSTVSVQINQAPFDKTAVVSFLSGVPDANASSLLAAPSSVTANGTSSATLTLELKDAFGNNMTSSVPNVSLSATRGTLGTVTELAYGKYQAQLTSTEAGSSTVSVQINQVVFDKTTVVRFLSGEPDADTLDFEVDSDRLPANGVDKAAISLKLLDPFGNALTQSGGDVEFNTNLGEIGTVTETTYGVYSAQISSSTPGIAIINASINGQQLGQTVEVSFVPFITKIAFDANQYETLTGTTVSTSVTVFYWNGNRGDVTAQSIFTMLNTAIATVDTTGLLRGYRSGQTTLTASFNGYEATVPVVITPAADGGNNSGDNPNQQPSTQPSSQPNPIKEPSIPDKEEEPVGGVSTPPGEGTGGTKQAIAFTDITGHWAQASITKAYEKGIIIGNPDGAFHPQAKVTRAEFAVMLARVLGLSSSPSAKQTQPNKEIWPTWASGAIGQLMDLGVFNGYSDGTFNPNRSMTRAEIAVVIYRAMKIADPARISEGQSSILTFNDSGSIPKWGKEAYEALLNEQILLGDNQNKLRPLDTANRAEAVTILLRFMQ